MLLRNMHLSPDGQPGVGEGGQPNTSEAKPTFDRSKLPAFLQKYPGNSLEEVHANADKGYWEMVNHTKGVLEKVSPLAEKAAAYDKLIGAVNGGQKAQKPAIVQLAEELGVDPSLVQQAMREESAGVFGAALTPILSEATAMQELESEPGFAQVKPHIDKWIKENPAVKAEFDALKSSGAVKAAWELAAFKWHAANPHAVSSPSKSAAGMVTGGQPNSTRHEATGPDPEKLKAATEYYQAYGDPRPMTNERLKGTSVEAQMKSMQDYMNGMGL